MPRTPGGLGNLFHEHVLGDASAVVVELKLTDCANTALVIPLSRPGPQQRGLGAAEHIPVRTLDRTALAWLSERRNGLDQNKNNKGGYLRSDQHQRRNP